MLFELIPLSRPLYVEGQSEVPAVGEFRGEVVAIGLRGSDPVAEAVPTGQESRPEPEALLGWGETYFLVADSGKPSPVWVAKDDVGTHRLLDAKERGAPS